MAKHSCLPGTAMMLLQLASAVALAQAQTQTASDKTPPAPPSILVLKTRVTGKAAESVDATTLSNLAATIFNDSGRYQVSSYEDVVAMLDAEQQKQLAGCDDVSCMADIGSALGTQFLLYTQVGEAGGVTVVSASVIEAAKAAAVDRQSVSIDNSRQIVDAVGVVCKRLLGEQAELPAPPPSAASFDPWFVAWPALGTGVVAGIVGLGGTGAALYFSGAAQDAQDSTAFEAYRGSGHTANTVALIGYVAGGVLLLGGASAAVLGLLRGSGDDGSTSGGSSAEEVKP
ncbi:MAG: hypothetical protein ABIJ09_09525 [Pseudomonadota bacterium]